MPEAGDRRRAAPTRPEAVAEGIIEAGWLVALVVTPLFFNPYSWRSFEPDKAALLQVLAGLMVTAWLAKVAVGGRAWRPAVQAPPAGRRVLKWTRIPLLVPAVLIGGTSLLAALMSVDCRLSWLGSYQRGYGVTVELACIAIFLLVLGHLRSRRQWRRAALAIVLASFPIAVCGLLQHLGLDPIQWSSERHRVGSSLGNPIFLGAYLVVVSFVTTWALGERLAGLLAPVPRATGAGASRQWAELLQVVVLLYVLALQAVALVLSQSRGPMLGILAGGFTYLLVGSLLTRRAGAAGTAFPAAQQNLLRGAWALVLSCGLAGVVLLVVVNLRDSPIAGLRSVPHVGRLGAVFDLESRTARVRLLIWQGSLDLLRSREPLREADGTPDPLSSWRPLVGFGPETFAFAFSRYEPLELARTVRDGAVPDRAHNGSIELIVTRGLLGWLASMIFFCAIFSHSLRWLGLAGSSGRRRALWIAMIVGGIGGATAPIALTGSAVLSGVGLSAGLVLGLLSFVTVSGLRGGDATSLGFREALILAILAAAVGHFVELAFGIAIAGTGVVLWILSAVLVAVGERWLDDPDGGAERSQQPRRVGLQAGDRRDGSILPEATAEGLTAGLLTAVILVTACYALVANPASAIRTRAVLAATLLGADGRGLSGVFWLLLLSLLVAAALFLPARGSLRHASRRAGAASFFIAATVPSVLYLVVQARRLAVDARLQAGGLDLVGAIEHVSRHVVVFAVLVLVLACGLGLSIAASVSCAPARPRSGLRAGLVAVAAATLIATVTAAALRPLRADCLLKYGGVVAERGRQRAGLELLERAAALDPLEPMHQLSLGTAAVASAQRSGGDDARRSLFDLAEAAFERARVLAPLDPDHTENLARLWSLEAREVPDSAVRTELLRRAWREYEAALTMRPFSTQLVVESVGVLEALGEAERAWELLEKSAALDAPGEQAALQLASIYRTIAEEAATAGDPVGEARALGRALAVLERGRDANPESAAVATVLAAMAARAGRLEAALEAYRLVLDRFGEDSRTHQTMALLHLAAGRAEPALRHAERGVELAGDQERIDAVRVLERVVAAAAGARREAVRN